MQVFAIAAIAENRVIGNENHLPWHLPADLRRFKQLITDHAIIMGRKTYQSIGRPLPQRTNIILSRQAAFHAPGCIVVTSISQALALASTHPIPADVVFIIGGGQIYQAFWSLLNRIYLTIVHTQLPGDTYFPPLNPNEWKIIEQESHAADELHQYAFSFQTLERINKS